MFDIAFDPDERPETQAALRNIPPSSQVSHPGLKLALVAYEKAIVEEREARQLHVQLEQELPASEYQDELALADAREKGKPDTGAKNAERALKAIAEAKRDAGARRIALQRAVEAVVAAGQEFGPAYETTLIEERDSLRSVISELLDGFERSWRALQVNASNRAIARGSSVTQKPEFFADSFRAPMIRDHDVVSVADVLAGLRGLAAPEKPKEAEPVQHRPLSQSPFASAGSSSQSLGRTVPDEQVAAWARKDAAEARQSAGLTEERRAERQGRAESRKAAREAVNDSDLEAMEATR